MSRSLRETSTLARASINNKIINWLFSHLLLEEINVEEKKSLDMEGWASQASIVVPLLNFYLNDFEQVFPLLDSDFIKNLAEAYLAIIKYIRPVSDDTLSSEQKIDYTEFKEIEILKELHAATEKLCSRTAHKSDGYIEIGIILPNLLLLSEQYTTWRDLHEKSLNEIFIKYKFFRLNLIANLVAMQKYLPLIKDVIKLEDSALIILKDYFKKITIPINVYFSDNYLMSFYINSEIKNIDDPDAGERSLDIDQIILDNAIVYNKLNYLGQEKNSLILSEQYAYSSAYIGFVEQCEFDEVYGLFLAYVKNYIDKGHAILIPNAAVFTLKNISHRIADTIIQHFENPEQLTPYSQLNFLLQQLILIIDYITNADFIQSYTNYYKENLSLNFCNWSVPAFFEIICFIQQLFLAKIRIIDIYAGVPKVNIQELLKNSLYEFLYLLNAQKILLFNLKYEFLKNYIGIWEFFLSDGFFTYNARERFQASISTKNKNLIYKLIPIADLLALNEAISSGLHLLEQKLEKSKKKEISPDCIKNIFITHSTKFYKQFFNQKTQSVQEQKNNDFFNVAGFTIYKDSFQAYLDLYYSVEQEKKIVETKKIPIKTNLKKSKLTKISTLKNIKIAITSVSIIHLEDKDPDMKPLYEIYNKAKQIIKIYNQNTRSEYDAVVKNYDKYKAQENSSKVKCVVHMHLTELNLTQSQCEFQYQLSIEDVSKRNFKFAIEMYNNGLSSLKEFRESISLLINADREIGLVHLSCMISLCKRFMKSLNIELAKLSASYVILKKGRDRLALFSWWYGNKSGDLSAMARARMDLKGNLTSTDSICKNFQSEVLTLEELKKASQESLRVQTI